MKKTFLFLILITMAFTINSCSSDSSEPSGTITLKVNGVQKTFHLFHANEATNLVGTPDEFTQVGIQSYSKQDPDWLMFSLKKGDLAGNVDYFTYVVDGDMGYEKTDNVIVHITSNGDDNKLIGTFSGDFGTSSDFITITEGTFDIKY